MTETSIHALASLLAAWSVWSAWAAPAGADDLPDFDALWNYADPTATEAKFRDLLPRAEASRNADYLAQLWTQIARTNSLRGRFDEAHAILDRVEKALTPETRTARVRYLLERGRTFRSAKQAEKARPPFLEAWDLGRAAGLDNLACDAAHMMAIVEAGDEAIAWNLKAMALAEASQDPKAKAWLGTLYNNMGWTFHDKGDFAKALDLFRKGLAWRRERRQPVETRIAKWCVGRALRSLGRVDEALATQRELETEWRTVGQEDGYVFEEIAECLTASTPPKPAEAKPYFAKAYALLKDKADRENVEAARIERLRTLGGVDVG